jgi:hypothetical protein
MVLSPSGAFISAQSGLLRHPFFSTRGLPWLKSVHRPGVDLKLGKKHLPCFSRIFFDKENV